MADDAVDTDPSSVAAVKRPGGDAAHNDVVRGTPSLVHLCHVLL